MSTKRPAPGEWLSRVEGLPRSAWPGWAKSAEKRSRVICHGAAATSSQASDLGVSIPRGHATTLMSQELCLRNTVCLLSPHRRALFADAFGDLDSSPLELAADSDGLPLSPPALDAACDSVQQMCATLPVMPGCRLCK